jgi:hypothetical protein
MARSHANPSPKLCGRRTKGKLQNFFGDLILIINFGYNFSDDLLIFGGGMPRASHSDRYTVTAMQGVDDKHVVFDFTSHVVDIAIVMPDKNSLAGNYDLINLKKMR